MLNVNVGLPVHFCHFDGKCRAAIITAVVNKPEGIVDLRIIGLTHDEDAALVDIRHEFASRRIVGTWHHISNCK